MVTDVPPDRPKPPPKDPKAERLAKALRDNLRRRKASPPTPTAGDPDEPSDP